MQQLNKAPSVIYSFSVPFPSLRPTPVFLPNMHLASSTSEWTHYIFHGLFSRKCFFACSQPTVCNTGFKSNVPECSVKKHVHVYFAHPLEINWFCWFPVKFERILFERRFKNQSDTSVSCRVKLNRTLLLIGWSIRHSCIQVPVFPAAEARHSNGKIGMPEGYRHWIGRACITM